MTIILLIAVADICIVQQHVVINLNRGKRRKISFNNNNLNPDLHLKYTHCGIYGEKVDNKV